ncbi:putative acetylornithine aminotransferase [Aspergillus aurantiobrunneus]
MTTLSALRADFITANPKSRAAFERARSVLPGGNTRAVFNSQPFPLVLESAQGCEVTSLDGRTYLDFASDFTAALHGHSHPVIRDAVAEALTKGFAHGGVMEKEAELGEIIRRRLPSMEKMRFCNSGTEANMYAVALALVVTKRNKILVLDGGYHGGTMSFRNSNSNPLNLPYDFLIGTYDSIPKTQALLNTITTDSLAAVIVEPMQSAGGVRPASPQFLSFLRETANTHNALLIFDECVTSRLHYHGMQGALGINPDLTTVGKYMGGGFPFGAFGGRTEIMDLFDPYVRGFGNPGALFHSGTFNGNHFTMSAAVAAAGLVTESEIERLNGLGGRLRNRAGEIVNDSGGGGGGLLSFSGYGREREELREMFYLLLLQRGIMNGGRGFVSLNLMHSDREVDLFLEGIQAFVDLQPFLKCLYQHSGTAYKGANIDKNSTQIATDYLVYKKRLW